MKRKRKAKYVNKYLDYDDDNGYFWHIVSAVVIVSPLLFMYFT